MFVIKNRGMLTSSIIVGIFAMMMISVLPAFAEPQINVDITPELNEHALPEKACDKIMKAFDKNGNPHLAVILSQKCHV